MSSTNIAIMQENSEIPIYDSKMTPSDANDTKDYMSLSNLGRGGDLERFSRPRFNSDEQAKPARRHAV